MGPGYIGALSGAWQGPGIHRSIQRTHSTWYLVGPRRSVCPVWLVEASLVRLVDAGGQRLGGFGFV